jgi:hypothetical protein
MRRIGLSLVVVAYIVVVVIFLVRDHKKDISSALGDSLDFIGGKLNAMVAESPDKKTATAAYEDFKKQVLEHKVPPEQVENIAANILNLSNSGVVLSSSEAEEMLQASFTIHVEKGLDEDSLAIMVEEIGVPEMSIYSQPRTTVTPDDLEKLNTRLSSIYAFETKMGDVMKDRKQSGVDFRRNMYYDSKNGLRLVVDPKSKVRTIKGEIAEIEIGLKNLESEELLVYNENLKIELENEKKKLEQELQLIIRTRHKNNNEKAKRAYELKRLETIKKLSLLGLYHVDKDSLNKIIKKIEQQTIEIMKATERVSKDPAKRK